MFQFLINGSSCKVEHIIFLSFSGVEIKPNINMNGTKWRKPTDSRPSPESQREHIFPLIKSLSHIEEHNSSQANLTRQREDYFCIEDHHFFRPNWFVKFILRSCHSIFKAPD